MDKTETKLYVVANGDRIDLDVRTIADARKYIRENYPECKEIYRERIRVSKSIKSFRV